MSQQILSTKTHRAGSFSWIFRTPFSGSCCWKRNQSLETLLSNYYLMHLGHIYDKLILLKKYIANKNWYIFSVFLSMSSCKSGHCAAHTFQGNPLLAVIMGSVLTSITCARPFLSSSARETTTQKFISDLRGWSWNKCRNSEVLSTTMSSSTCTWATRAINGPAPAPRYSKHWSLCFFIPECSGQSIKKIGKLTCKLVYIDKNRFWSNDFLPIVHRNRGTWISYFGVSNQFLWVDWLICNGCVTSTTTYMSGGGRGLGVLLRDTL